MIDHLPASFPKVCLICFSDELVRYGFLHLLYNTFLQGITNTVGAVPGIVGVALTGYLLDSTHSWGVSSFINSLEIAYKLKNLPFQLNTIFHVDVAVCSVDLLLPYRNSCMVGISKQ